MGGTSPLCSCAATSFSSLTIPPLLLAAALLAAAPAGAAEPIELPAGPPIESVDFERHVAPLFSLLGCNAGSCHGASKGQGGFRLSLFGGDKRLDHAALTEPDSGRVVLEQPASSLILEKPTLAIDHEGGLRLQHGSWQHQLITRWIEGGARHVPGSGRLLRLDVEPHETVLTDTDPCATLHVMATFANGDRADVTSLSQLRVQDDTVAAIDDHSGTLKRKSAGDTAVIATYNGRPAHALVLSPRASALASPATVTAGNGLIDGHVADKLRRLRIRPSPPCSDETFLRRLTLSTIGQLPSPQAIRQFVADPSPDKRDRQIDALLSNPLHAALWATRMCEITGSGDFGQQQQLPPHEEKWHAWFRSRFAANTPYDDIARGVLCATTRGRRSAAEFIAARVRASQRDGGDDAQRYADRPSLDLFWQRPKVNEEIEIEAVTERISAAFLGIRMECARCHKHPFDRWTRNDHRSLANVFGQVRFGMSPELRSSLVDALEEQRERARQGQGTRPIPRMREVYLSRTVSDLRDLATREPLPARPLGGQVMPADGDRREAFARWLTSADNPYFARNFVNRVWAWHFGVGLVDPVDAFSAGNPPSHPGLLDALAEDFVQHGFDVRRLERQILRSQTWQRAAAANDTNRADGRNFARAYVRVLPADVVVDAISCAIGDQPFRAVEVPGRLSGNKSVDEYFGIFSRPERKLTCDCERSDQPTLRQTMLLLADPDLMKRIAQGRAAKLAASEASDDRVVEELFLLTLSRPPDDDERRAALEHIESAGDRQSACCDLMWSLINTREFVTFH